MKFPVNVLMMAVLLTAGAAWAQTTIDFGPALPGAPTGDWTILADQLTSYGVTFSTTAPGGVAWIGPTYAWEPARYSIASIETAPQQAPWGTEPIRVDFDPYITAASIHGFDNSGDMDALAMKAFDSTGTLVDSMSVLSPVGATASVQAAEIAYVTFEGASLIGDGLFFDDLTFTPAEPGPQEVSIALRPNGQTVNVNLRSKGVLPLIMYGSEALDVHDVVQLSLALGDSAPKPRGKSGKTGILADFNGDSYDDLQLLFPVADIGLEPGQTELSLWGELTDGTEIVGTAEVNVLSLGAASELAGLSQGQPLPEPTCAALLAVGLLGLARRRRAK